MKKLKFHILFVILFMTIGIAAVTTSNLISGSTSLTNNPDDFDVYFDYVTQNFGGVSSPGTILVIDNEKSFSFDVSLDKVDETLMLDMYITNASKNYDADVSYTCNYDSEYILVSSSIESADSAIIEARSRKLATLDIKLIKSYAGDGEIKVPVTCTLVATAVERNSKVEDDVFAPVQGRYSVGAEIAIGDEKFNIIRDNGDGTISMLAQSGIDDSAIQFTVDPVSFDFGGFGNWGFSDEPIDIDVQEYDNDLKWLINGYVDYLKTTTGDINLSGDMISLKELGDLGCDVPDDYKTRFGVDTCVNSPYADWLIKDYWWWTKSVRGDYENTLWVVSSKYFVSQGRGNLSPIDGEWDCSADCGVDGTIYGYHSSDLNSVRPVITISKAALEGKLITFTIADVSYNAIDGMTWGEWVDSRYNTSGFFISDDFYIMSLDHRMVYLDGVVLSDSLILSAKEYSYIRSSPVPGT